MAFWGPKLRVVRERTIPHSWHYLQWELRSLRRAAGETVEGELNGTWGEANLYKFLETVAYVLERVLYNAAIYWGTWWWSGGAQRMDGAFRPSLSTPWRTEDPPPRKSGLSRKRWGRQTRGGGAPSIGRYRRVSPKVGATHRTHLLASVPILSSVMLESQNKIDRRGESCPSVVP